MSIIRVTYHSDILGSGEFWREGSRFSKPKNVVAERLVEYMRHNPQVQTKTVGMWTVERIKERAE